MRGRPQLYILDADSEMTALIAAQVSASSLASEVVVSPVGSVSELIQRFKQSPADLLILGSRIPEMSCTDCVQKTRQTFLDSKFAVLVLTNPSEAIDEAQWREKGVDDTLAKPFDRAQLENRVQALLRKVRPTEGSEPPQSGKRVFGEIMLNTRTYDVFSGSDRVSLTPNEFKLLQFLMERPATVLSREQIIEFVQGAGIAVVDRAIDTHVASLRKKLGPSGECIETVRGEGYRLRSLE